MMNVWIGWSIQRIENNNKTGERPTLPFLIEKGKSMKRILFVSALVLLCTCRHSAGQENIWNELSDYAKQRIHGYSALVTVEAFIKGTEEAASPTQLYAYQYEINWLFNHLQAGSGGSEMAIMGPRCKKANIWIQQRINGWTSEHPPVQQKEVDPLQKPN